MCSGYKHGGQLATNTWSSYSELFPRWWLTLSVSLFTVTSPWEISSCLKRFPFRWLCFQLPDLRGSSCWFDGAFVAVELKYIVLGFLQPSQQGFTWKCSQDVLFRTRPLSFSLYPSISLSLWGFSLIQQVLYSVPHLGFPQPKSTVTSSWSNLCLHPTTLWLNSKEVFYRTQVIWKYVFTWLCLLVHPHSLLLMLPWQFRKSCVWKYTPLLSQVYERTENWFHFQKPCLEEDLWGSGYLIWLILSVFTSVCFPLCSSAESLRAVVSWKRKVVV